MAGEKISGFLNGFLSPLTNTLGGVSQAGSNLLGTTSTTTTTGNPDKESNSRTTLIVVSVLAVVLLVSITFVLLKKQNT